MTFVGEEPVARKKLDCSECGAEYTITGPADEDPSYCPFCGDPGTNLIGDKSDDDEDDDEDGFDADDEDE